jgi:superkiller protein 3
MTESEFIVPHKTLTRFVPVSLATLVGLMSCAWIPSPAVTVDSLMLPHYSPAQSVASSEYYDLQQASVLMNRKQYTAAIPLLKNASEKAPTNLLALFNLGHCYMELAKSVKSPQEQASLLEEAENTFLRVESLNDEYAATYFKLGKIALMQEALDRAELYYQKGLALEPTNAGFLFNLAGIYDQQNKLDEAIALYRKAIELDPEFAFAYNNLGLVYERQKRLQEAEQAYRMALRKDPTYQYARLNLGNLCAESNRLNEAEQLYSEVLQADPKDSWAHLYLGNIHLKRGNLEKAVAAYKASAHANPTYPTTYYLLAITLERLNRYDEAMQASLSYLRLSPDGDFASEMKVMLVSLRNQQSASLKLLPKDSRLKCCDP